MKKIILIIFAVLILSGIGKMQVLTDKEMI